MPLGLTLSLSLLIMALPGMTAFGQEKPASRADQPPETRSEKPAAPEKSSEQPPKVEADSNSAAAVTVEKIMDQAVRNISKRYNLNEEQTKVTDEVMKRRVRQFLKDHESEVWPLIREMILTQFGAKPPDDPEEVKRLGTAGKPLVEKAKKAILEGNDEWRRYLTPEQQRMHDYDLSEMEKTFQKINENLDQWAEGKPPKGGLFPPPPPPSQSPATPPRPPSGLPKPPDPEVVVVRETFFDAFVDQFIKDNELDPGQITAARSILNEFKAKVGDFRSSNKEEVGKLVATRQAAATSRDREQLAAAEESRRRVLQPVYDLFEEMESRLAALLTSSQLERYQAGKAAVDPVARREAIDGEVVPELAPPKPNTAKRAKAAGQQDSPQKSD